VAFAGYCKVNDNFYIAISAEPTSYISKALTRVYGRDYLCSSYTSGSTCSAQASALGCYWTSQKCTARELSDWSWFSRHAYLEEAPSWMLCPDSQAATMKKCSSGLQGSACTTTKGCALDSKGFCGPAFFTGKTQDQKEDWFNKFRAMDPAIHGECESACYLKGIFGCSSYYNIKPATAQQAACKKNSFCSWDGTQCRQLLLGTDAWGQAAAKAGVLCPTLSKDVNTCQRGPIGAIIQTARVQLYKDWV